MNAVSKQLRIAVVGAGYFSRFHYEAWSRLGEARLVAGADRDAAKIQETAAQYGNFPSFADAAEMLRGVEADLLDIVTPPETHLGLIGLAAGRGLAIICQKPFCRSLAEAREAVAIAEAAGVPLIVHENFRFQPWYREIRRRIEAGALGQLYQISFRLRPGDGQGPSAYLDRQPYFQRMPRFLIHETAIHFIDTFRFLAGEISAVTARLRRLNPAIAGEDAGLVIFEHENAAWSLFDGNRLSDHRAENRRLTLGEMWVEGAHGVLRLTGAGALSMRTHMDDEETAIDYDWTPRGFGADSVFALQQSAVKAILDGRSPENAARDYLRNLEIEEAIYASHTLGRRIAIGLES